MSSSKAVPTRLLIVDDDLGMHTLVRDLFADKSINVLSAMTLAEGLKLASQQRIDIVLLDHLLPDGQGIDHISEFIAHDRLLPILYITAQAGSKTAIEAIKRGAFEYLSKPIDFKLLLQRVDEAIEYRHLTRLPVLVDIASNKESESDVLVGRCRGMQEVYKSIGRLSNLRSPILIEGEIGTGKEMIARAIHQNGSHASGGFRKISCNEFEDSPMQIELFGRIHSNTLALGEPPSDRPSATRIPALLDCSGGTLMIDDVDNLSVAGQSRLLRFFQSNSIDGISADTRVILATSTPIRELVQSGRIRNDLFYFLSTFIIRVPALRDRREDLELLVSHFIQRIAHVSSAQQGQGPPRVSSAALQLLKEYDWPGNIAELKSVLQGVLTESRGAILASDALRLFLQASSSTDSRSVAELTNSQTTPAAVQATSTNKFEVGQVWDLKAFVDEQVALGTERLYEQAVERLDSQLLKLVLEHTSGNRVKAAKLLGITRTSLRRKMNNGLLTELGTDPSDDLRPGDEHD